ncbi:hypothetical protein TSO5_03435 [Azospirillum sp. TSO5]|nr:hypothetical protein TSO5_03435 [Azospirillum sp. TSO5]
MLIGALVAAGCMPLEAAGRVALAVGHAGQADKPARPTSDVEVVHCRVAGGAEVYTAPRNCVGGRTP